MKHELHIAKRAERDRDEAFRWYRENYSEQFAIEWYAGISRAIKSLARNPERCGFARENDQVAFDLRELLFGQSREHRHRVLYTLSGNTIHILHIRHTARDEFDAKDLP